MVTNVLPHQSDACEPNAEMLAINEQLLLASIRYQELAETSLSSEIRLTDIVHGIDAVICEVAPRNGQPMYLSIPKLLFLGRHQESWYSQSGFLTEIVKVEDRELTRLIIETAVRRKLDFEYEFRAFSPSDELIWMRNIVRVVENSAGEVQLLRCVIIDITEQKAMSAVLQKAYLRERHITETLQRSLLFMPPEDAFPGLAVKTMYEAASEEALVGGDFWDTFAYDHGKVALVLGDVMGHGLPAAIFTAELKYALRGFVREHQEPARILQQMNSYLCETTRLFGEGLNNEGNGDPLCLILAILDTTTGKGTVAVAGMEPMLILRRSGEMEEVKVAGMQLGVSRDEQYDETTFQLELGDWVVLTTDGVTEARTGKDFLGYGGLMKLVAEGQHTGSLQGMALTIIDGARIFAGGNLRDDACVMVAQRQ